ncbi:hypothetical protein LX36DRAFT_568570 [Colletotrichum falcatum]|nr:hypothetical protein LX36DRAFT_568570 [Colletotrichum falcatum]
MTSPRTLHRSSAKIRQITGLDLEYNGFKRAPVRPPRSPLGPDTEAPATPDNSGSVHRAEKQVSASEPARTLSMIDDYDEESDAESTEWDFSPSARRRIPSWIPASPVPPRVEISDFDEASPRRRDSEIGPLRSPGMHHFETLPARRNNHMEVSYVGAKDLYHATATSIANSTRRKMAEMAQDSVDATQDSGLSPKNSMSFATKVLQSGRRRPPVGINTKPQSPQCPGASTSSSTGKQSLGSSERPDVHAHSMDDDRLRVKYSDALSRVFRWSGEHRRDGTSAVDATPPPLPTTTTTTTPSESGSAGSPLAVPDLPSSKTISRRSVQVIAAQFKKTANSIVLSKDERRRENLRQSIRMIPEGNLL